VQYSGRALDSYTSEVAGSILSPYNASNLRYKQILVEVGAFQRGWVSLRVNFRWKGTSTPTNFGIRKLECFCYLTRAGQLSLLISVEREMSMSSSLLSVGYGMKI